MSDFKAFIDKHGSTALIVTSIIATISALILTAMGKEHADEALWNAEVEKGEALTRTEAFKVAWKYYVPATIATLTSASCTIGAHKMDQKSILNLSTACNTAIGTAEILDRHLKESSTPEKYSEIKKEIGDKIEHDKKKTNYIPSNVGYDDGLSWFRESHTGQWRRMNMEDFRHAKNNIKEIIGYGEDVDLNTYLAEFGFDPVELGYDLVWHGSLDGVLIPLDINVTAFNSEIDGAPYNLIETSRAPKVKR